MTASRKSPASHRDQVQLRPRGQRPDLERLESGQLQLRMVVGWDRSCRHLQALEACLATPCFGDLMRSQVVCSFWRGGARGSLAVARDDGFVFNFAMER